MFLLENTPFAIFTKEQIVLLGLGPRLQQVELLVPVELTCRSWNQYFYWITSVKQMFIDYPTFL